MILTQWAAEIVGGITEPVRRDLSESLVVAIELHFGLVVTPSEAFATRGAGGWCDGVSIIDGGLILYRPTASRRENFTLMHELAHHLIANDIDCVSWLADQAEPPRVLEQLCDLVAAELLLPPDEVTAALSGRPPDAPAVVALGVDIARRASPQPGAVCLFRAGASCFEARI